MGAVAIYICHDCKVSTETPGNDSTTHYMKIPGVGADRAFEIFKMEHVGHDVVMKSDAHGQINKDDYDFEKREFKFEGFY